MTSTLALLLLCCVTGQGFAAGGHGSHGGQGGYGYAPSYYYGYLHKHTTTTHSPYVYFKRHTIPYEDLYESTYTDHFVFHTPSPCYGYDCGQSKGGGYGGDHGSGHGGGDGGHNEGGYGGEDGSYGGGGYGRGGYGRGGHGGGDYGGGGDGGGGHGGGGYGGGGYGGGDSGGDYGGGGGGDYGGGGGGNSGYGGSDIGQSDYSSYGNDGYGSSGYGSSGYGSNGGGDYGNSGYGSSGYGSNGGGAYGNSGYGSSGYGSQNIGHEIQGGNVVDNSQKGQRSSSYGNEVVDIKTKCDSDAKTFTVELTFKQSFYGKVFAKGYYGIYMCSVQGDGSYHISFTLPLDGCGTQESVDVKKGGYESSYSQTYSYHNTLVVMENGGYGVLESSDRAYAIFCSIEDQAKPQPTQQTHSGRRGGYGNQDAQPIRATKEEMPNVYLKVVDGHDPSGSPTTGLVVGQYASLIVYYKPSYEHDVSVTNCFAHDGTGYYKVLLIDADGCSTNKDFISELQQSESGYNAEKNIYTTFKAFKFPDRYNVYFQCSIEVCSGQCSTKQSCRNDVYGSSNDGYSQNNRLKRSVSGNSSVTVEPPVINATSTAASATNSSTVDQRELFRALTVILPGEEPLSDSFELGRRFATQQGMCITRAGFAWGMAIMGGILLVSALLCLTMYMRARRTTETDAVDDIMMEKQKASEKL
ncbi:PREDICTED: filaggrin-2-like [Priapulus caudatus]|uniref:Filaggrin-2-like n=1 Tax=Priapulus caudatus TaxID=37621 RepID=A0ABM1F8D8_PRICU|nr:PREDICTED: filaggrin-2-like [Priapulus caudatus]